MSLGHNRRLDRAFEPFIEDLMKDLKGEIMTNKHFIALADALKATRPIQGIGMNGSKVWERELVRLEQWEFDRDRIADFCIDQNPNFNLALWLGYIAGNCGPNGGKL